MSKKNIIIFHIVLWIYLLYPKASPLIFESDIQPDFLKVLPLSIAYCAIMFYLFYLLIIPKIFKNRINGRNAVMGVIILLTLTLFKLVGYHYFNICFMSSPEKYNAFAMLEFTDEFLSSLVFALYAYWVRFAIDWFGHQKQRAELINKAQASELALLRTQINPHFLFNTLNNIYALVIKNSDDAPKAIMKLSSIMRYMLYESNTDKVLLEKEVEFLKGFIELQSLRIKEPDFVEFKINGKVSEAVIAPMLLMPFVENAFKHGNREAPIPGIAISIHVQPKKINFEVLNYYSSSFPEEKNPAGLGLQKIKRRLELIYPQNHHLEVNSENGMYHIKLELKS